MTRRNWTLVAARDNAYAASMHLAKAEAFASAASAAVHAAWAEYQRLCDAAEAPEATASLAVARLRRVAVRPAPAVEARRPAAEHAALLAGAYDDGPADAERAAARFDGAGGVPRADRVDARVWVLSLLPDGTEMWQTHPDPVEF